MRSALKSVAPTGGRSHVRISADRWEGWAPENDANFVHSSRVFALSGEVLVKPGSECAESALPRCLPDPIWNKSSQE
jgi:hypothetical protein